MIRWKDGHATTRTWPDGYGKPSVDVPSPAYEGATLGTTGRDERIMSDVWAWTTYAVVWDAAEAKIKEVAIGNSEFGSYGEAVVDATADARSAALEYLTAKELEARTRAHDRRVDEIVYAASRPAVGRDVVVARGRKVPKGTVGTIFWVGESTYGYRRTLRVGLRTADGETHWTAAANCDVLNPDDYVDVEALMARPNFAGAAALAASATMTEWMMGGRRAA